MITIIKLKNEVLKSYKSGELNKNETNYFLNKLTWLQVNPIISNAQNCVLIITILAAVLQVLLNMWVWIN